MRTTELQQVKGAIRNPHTWPGGYPVYILMADGELMCPTCARTNYKLIVNDTARYRSGSWQAAGAMILWEGVETCCHCGKTLDSAYGEVSE